MQRNMLRSKQKVWEEKNGKFSFVKVVAAESTNYWSLGLQFTDICVCVYRGGMFIHVSVSVRKLNPPQSADMFVSENETYMIWFQERMYECVVASRSIRRPYFVMCHVSGPAFRQPTPHQRKDRHMIPTAAKEQQLMALKYNIWSSVGFQVK
jgi:hypothetical protein